jgi:hypothetical protein
VRVGGGAYKIAETGVRACCMLRWQVGGWVGGCGPVTQQRRQLADTSGAALAHRVPAAEGLELRTRLVHVVVEGDVEVGELQVPHVPLVHLPGGGSARCSACVQHA